MDNNNLNKNFNRFSTGDSIVPIWNLTPEGSGYFHRFFDTCPVSPSGRYLALLKMPFEDRPPMPGEEAAIVVIDLENGTEKIVDQTKGWECQLGANINWGASDEVLLYSDVDTEIWRPHCVRLNFFTGERKIFGKGIYHVSPDGQWIACSSPELMRRTQPGYGVMIPEENIRRNYGLREDDGVYLTNVETEECKQLISIKEVVERTQAQVSYPDLKQMENYIFHTKWSPDGSRLLFSLRSYPKDDQTPMTRMKYNMFFNVYTIKPDGTELYNAVSDKYWALGGHHINWFPNSRKLSMNLGFKEDGIMRLTQVNYDGTELKMMMEEPIGSGHPTIHPDGRYLATDAYQFEPVTKNDGTVPMRLINLETREQQVLFNIDVTTEEQSKYIDLRVDAHPVWSRCARYLLFNGLDEAKKRRVFIADVDELVNS